MQLAGQKIAVLGAGTSGLASARLAVSRGATVVAFDSGDSTKLQPAVDRFAGFEIELVTGDAALKPSADFDLCVTSPGISLEWEIAKGFSNQGIEIIGEIELAWMLGGKDKPIIGITGTNGKTTTTDLLANILNGAGVKTVPCGNYGLAWCEVIRSGEEYDAHTVELSSFQLETIKGFRPDVAVWMNFAPDHMDRYTALDEYREAKERIFENQSADDLAVTKHEDDKMVPGRRLSFSAFSENADYRYDNGVIVGPDNETLLNYRETGLNGKHNAENVMAAMAAAHGIGVAYESMVDSVMSYAAPEHRCEPVATKGGVTFINDSKSTNLHSLESSLRGQDDRVVLIAGGKQKGLDFSELDQVVGEKVKNAICIGEIGAEICDLWSAKVASQTAGDLEEAVALAFEKCSAGDTILFSPGTSSFDMFSGYEERGRCFKEAVNRLSG